MSARLDLPAFFTRNGLTDADYHRCLRFAHEKCPNRHLQILQEQGGCSFTLRGSSRPEDGGQDAVIVQFRLPQYAVQIHLASAATSLYPALVPQTLDLGYVELQNSRRLQALQMPCLSGKRFSELQPRTSALPGGALAAMLGLVRALATFFTMQWSKPAGSRVVPGRIGISILERLQALEKNLPTGKLRQHAGIVRKEVENGVLDTLPTVLTHGDLVPSNILVDETTWGIEGLVDWAEAECLPFGISLYGLEHLLGYLENRSGEGKPRFCYYTQAEELRDAFWTELEQHCPAIVVGPVRSAIGVAREVGILLWHGIAWDDGRLNRVINAADDEVELELLQAFLGVRSRQQRHDSIVDYSRPVLYAV